MDRKLESHYATRRGYNAPAKTSTTTTTKTGDQGFAAANVIPSSNGNPMEIPWEPHGNGNGTPTWELEWERVGVGADWNRNDPYSHGKNSHGFLLL